ncbi:NB-ARC domain-containing protein, partial [Streptomyces sp. NPDC007369]|uniref:NB-ARC domain-containing protein n=1 Tax=Streptomyces sp. NPDC007369 TaxID=3154589 RepID=UPI0033DF3BC1
MPAGRSPGARWPGERAALYRSLLADRRVLVVLDDAAEGDRVRALLPGAAPRCAVLVTGRRRLASLDRHTALELPLLDEAGAPALLGRVAGAARVAAEPEAARRLMRLCGRLPLALRIAGAELAAPPPPGTGPARRPFGGRAGPPRRSRRRTGRPAARLPRAARRCPRPAPRAGAPRRTALGRVDRRGRARQHAVRRRGRPGRPRRGAPRGGGRPRRGGGLRYRMHDLVRALGREPAGPPGRAEPVLRRVPACWVALVREGRRAHQGRDYPGLPGRAPARVPDTALLAGPRADPVRWLGAERDALVATVRQAARVDPYACRELAAAGEYVFDLRSDLAGWQAVQEAGLAAARSAGDRAGEAVLLVGLGRLRACRAGPPPPPRPRPAGGGGARPRRGGAG